MSRGFPGGRIAAGAAAKAWPPIVFLAAGALVVLLGGLGDDALQRTITLGYINVTLVVGLYLFSGPSGVLSFGHVSFVAVGAYVGAILMIVPAQKEFLLPGLPAVLATTQVTPMAATLLAGLAAALVALVLAPPLMRIAGLAASLGLFAVLLIIHVVVGNWDAVTRGQEGLFGIPSSLTLWTAFGWAAGAIVIAFAFQQASVGLKLRATREDEPAARALGISVFRERSAALVLSAFVVGVGGAEYAQFLGAFGPNAFYLTLTFIMIAMAIIGGLGSLSGAVIGTVVVSVLIEVLRRFEDGVSVGGMTVGGKPGIQHIGVGVAMLVVLWLRPNGVMAGRELRAPWDFRAGGGVKAPDEPASLP